MKTLVRGGTTLAKAVKALYLEGQTDYALEPLVLTDADRQPIGRIQAGDAVIFCCRRGEREVELTEAFTDPGFDYFPRSDLDNLIFVILTLYHEKFKDLPIAFAPKQIPNTLGEIISRAGLRQLRVAESEKYSHVTYFLNGGYNHPFPGEDDVRIPSPKGIPFEQVPELSLDRVAEQVIQGIEKGYDLIVTNFANGDVIGHTASRDAKIKCAESVDTHLNRVVKTGLENGYVILITADHGNLEKLWNADGSPHMAHTSNPVNFILLDPSARTPIDLKDGRLADIAPTILSALGIDQPSELDGIHLAPRHAWGGKRQVLLVILDGWGIGEADDTNPIFLASTPHWDDLLNNYPSSRLQASGEAVGLQSDKPGNSEAGHMNIGAGRVILQDDVRLDRALKDGTFYTNETFIHTLQSVKQRSSRLHLISLLSEKSSHGSIEYPLELLKMARDNGLENVYLHVIFDGRSTAPGSAPSLLEKLESKMVEIGLGQIVTGIGRGIALDRDGNYAKIQRAYNAFVYGSGQKVVLESVDPEA
jgi:2,3-bisphosphoglycerate-independent phosphoglycerate mutase